MGMIHYNHLLLAPSVFKRMFIYMLLRLTGNYKEMHGLIVNFEANPACHDSTQKLKQLYTLAAERTVQLINEYNDYLIKKDKLSAFYDWTFSGTQKEEE